MTSKSHKSVTIDRILGNYGMSLCVTTISEFGGMTFAAIVPRDHVERVLGVATAGSGESVPFFEVLSPSAGTSDFDHFPYAFGNSLGKTLQSLETKLENFMNYRGLKSAVSRKPKFPEIFVFPSPLT